MRNTKLNASLRQKLAAIVVAITITFSCRGWSQANAFTSSLRCGMPIDEVRSRAIANGAAHFIADARSPILYGTHVAAEGSSRVYLAFSEGRLKWFRTGTLSGPWTGIRIGLKENLCDGGEFISLVLHGSAGWEGATVLIDDRAAGSLSPDPSALLEADVPPGRHELVIRNRAATYRKALSFDRTTKGIVQIDIPR